MPSPAPQASLRRLAFQLLPMLVVLTMPLAVRPVSSARAQAAIEGDVRLSPAMSTVPVGGGPFTVYVVLEGLQHAGNVNYDDDRDGTPDRSVPSEGLGAFQFTIEYDPAIVEFQDVERGPSLGQTGRSFQCLPAARDTGTITFGCLSPGGSPPGAQGTLTLGSVQFTPRSNGLSPLVLSAEIAGPLGDSAEVNVGGGAVRISGESPTVKPTHASSTATTTGGAVSPMLTPRRTNGPGEPTATARNTIPASGTPGGTPAELTPRQSVTPNATPTLGPKHDGSDSRVWLWSIGIAVALACGALGLTAILWRRRGQGGF